MKGKVLERERGGGKGVVGRGGQRGKRKTRRKKSKGCWKVAKKKEEKGNE